MHEPELNFVTLCSGTYWMGFAALVESIRINSGIPLQRYQFIVYTNKAVPEFVSQWIENRKETIHIRTSEFLDTITSHVPQEQPNLEEALKKLALLGEGSNDEKSLYCMIDSDMICLNRLDGIFDLPPFAAAPDSMLEPIQTYEASNLTGPINTGFFTYRPSTTLRDRLISIYEANPAAYCKAADQDVINAWLKESTKGQRISTDWNTMKYVFRDRNKRENQTLLKRIKILHFIKTKPWSRIHQTEKFRNQRSLLTIEALWWHHFKASKMEDPEHYIFKTSIHSLLRYLSSLKQHLVYHLKIKMGCDQK